jgi:XRE family transcriptional regulator, stress-response regulator
MNSTTPAAGGPANTLLREHLGDALRRHRLRQGRTLREVSASARVSLAYLSEIERGRKEASSELLNAVCEALDVPMSSLLLEVSDQLALAELATRMPMRSRRIDARSMQVHREQGPGANPMVSLAASAA